jgi:hypothetical protein
MLLFVSIVEHHAVQDSDKGGLPIASVTLVDIPTMFDFCSTCKLSHAVACLQLQEACVALLAVISSIFGPNHTDVCLLLLVRQVLACLMYTVAATSHYNLHMLLRVMSTLQSVRASSPHLSSDMQHLLYAQDSFHDLTRGGLLARKRTQASAASLLAVGATPADAASSNSHSTAQPGRHC